MSQKPQPVESNASLQQLDQAETMLRKLLRAVEQSADGVVITDRNGIIEYANPAFEKLTGYSFAEVMGRNPRMLKSGEQPPELYRELWQTILSGNVFRGVLANRKKTGEVVYVEKTITPVRDGDDRITHFISNDRDITERRKLEAELRQAQKMDAIGRLAGGVAHDFNNLLLVISAYAELSLDALSEESPLRRNLLEIVGASRRAADLTRQLLAFGRKQMQVLQVLDVNSVVQRISAMLPRLIGEDIQLVVTPGNEIGNVKTDPVQIEQILMNLSANARDAMPGGGTLTIETSRVELDESYTREHVIVPPGEYVLLAVTDTGQGIAPEHINHIFEPFYTTKAEGKGTGLGLSTVYGIVKQNHGFIWVYSELGLGTTFKVYLPSVHSAKSLKRAPGLARDCRGGHETVLLVEDETPVRESTAAFLNLNGYTVLEARNGQDALHVARGFAEPIDLMISDVVMPHMGGVQVAEQLAAERANMKVLFMSGYAESTVLRHGVVDVRSCFLQKPFTLRALACKIREILEQQGEARARAAGCP